MLPILIQILKQKGYNIDINKTYNGIVKSYTDVKNQVDVIKQESEVRNTLCRKSRYWNYFCPPPPLTSSQNSVKQAPGKDYTECPAGRDWGG